MAQPADRYSLAQPHAVRVWSSLLGVSALAWLAWLLVRARMPMDLAMPMPRASGWPQAAAEIGLFGGMWAVMMIAMMIPSAAPAVALFAAIQRSHRASPFGTPVFVLGYLAAWVGFSLLASLAQWALGSVGLAGDLLAARPVAAGIVLAVAGAFQWTSAKHACLSHCRSPQSFFMQHWRSGAAGAFALGLRHGLYCLGCCALLMTVLFVAGAMNPVWAAGLAALVLVEKAAPAGRWLGYLAGAGLLGWGVWLVVAGIR